MVGTITDIADDDPLLKEKQEILATVMTWFHHDGALTVNDDLSVDVTGEVQLRKRPLPDGEIPVRFGEVNTFMVDGAGLKSFKNSPRRVVKHMWAYNNPLESLDHAPDHVGGFFGIARTRITHLTGLPEGVQTLTLDYHAHMPLLRSLVASKIDFPNFNKPAPDQVKVILNKYAGEGKKAALACAAELVKAGYKDNARW